MNGHTNVYVCTVDTDVVAILIGKFHCLVAFCQSLNIWVAFGAGKHFTYYHINTICQKLGTERSIALPVFHSFTGCDTASSFYGKGKRSAWEACDDVTQMFTYMALHPLSIIDIDSPHFKLLEHFTVIMYDKTSELQCVNESRKDLFCHKGI